MSMSSYGLEIAFWTILSIYVLSRLGLLKKWQKCLKSYNGYTGRRKTPIGGVKTCPPDLWSDEVPVIATDLKQNTRGNQLTQAQARSINARSHTRARFSCHALSLAICRPCETTTNFFSGGLGWTSSCIICSVLTDTPWYTENRESCFMFTLLISPFRVREINKLNNNSSPNIFDNNPESGPDRKGL